MTEAEKWEEYSEAYDEKIFSLTSIPQRRKQILGVIKRGKILNLGAGSTPYLNRDLVNDGNKVVATDFCFAMLETSQKEFAHPNTRYVLTDSKKLSFFKETLDSVISVNSILPPTRNEVQPMISEVYRILKRGGQLIAFLPSYDNVIRAINNLGLKLRTDDKQLRVADTNDWQCFHTPESIKKMMQVAGFTDYKFKKVFLKTRQEIAELKRIYGVDTSKSLAYEYFLVARK